MKQAPQRFETRQNMNRPDFEIFHYKDSEPGSVEIHHHDFYEVYCFLGGDVEYHVEGKVYRLERGDMLLISPMELHHPTVLSGAYERIVLWISREYLLSCSEKLTRCFDISLPTHKNLLRADAGEANRLLTQMETLVREFHSDAYCSDLCAKGILLQFLAELNRIATEPLPEDESDLPLSAQVVSYIGRHYREPLSLDSIAERFYVSKYHLSHVFSKTTGISVYRYIVLKRLQVAREMLLEGQTPKDAYRASGFGDYANFYRAFQAEYGVTPSSFPEK